MKKFLACLLILCFAFVPFVFAGCETINLIKLEGGPTEQDEVVGNGGYVVQKGEYIYFASGYVKTSDLGTGGLNNNFGEVENGALYRAKVEYQTTGSEEEENLTEKMAISNVELLLSKLVGFDNSGLYIFGNKIYFGTPATSWASDGTVEYDQITFYSLSLNGTNLTKIYQTTDFDGGEYKFVCVDNIVCLIVNTGSKLLKVELNGKATVLAEDIKTAVILEDKVYYTKDNEKTTDSLDFGTVLYVKEIKSLEETKLFDEDYLTIELIKMGNGKLYYTRNYLLSEKSPSSTSYSYVNTLNGNTFAEGETKLLNQAGISSFVEINGGCAYINSSKLYFKKNAETKELSSDATKILFTQGNFVYFKNSSALYRIDVSLSNPSSKKLSASNTINTDYFDFDNNFVYFFVKNSSTSKYELYSLDIKYLASTITPTKVK
ncbi:MAG: hypothetical protein J5779_00435 [Clostridia bacterium]|nr:hypothetical protein [Clostridia bacterium]